MKSVIFCHGLYHNSNFIFAPFFAKLQPTAFHEKAIFLSFMSTAFEKLCKSVQQTKPLCRKFVINVNFAHWLLIIFLTKCLCIFNAMPSFDYQSSHIPKMLERKGIGKKWGCMLGFWEGRKSPFLVLRQDVKERKVGKRDWKRVFVKRGQMKKSLLLARGVSFFYRKM